MPGTRFFSLQVGKFQPELQGLDPALGVVDLAPGLKDFGDTAAAIEALDLVITVDTGVLHLTGAVDRPAWGLMSKPTGFLWMNGRDDSPWYPKLRLEEAGFRVTVAGPAAGHTYRGKHGYPCRSDAAIGEPESFF